MANTYTQCYSPKKKPFKEEYWEMLEKNNVDFNQEYLFDFFDDIYEWDWILRCPAPLVVFINLIFATNILQLCCIQ